ncbi:Crooked neck-like protein 1 [Sarracenia purpurea var. burkii]
MEEILGNVAGVRKVFKRWMNWQPDQQGWLSYIKFELCYNEIERARAILERFVQCHPKVSSWIRYAKFEMKSGEIGRAWNSYERVVDKLADDEEVKHLFVAFAEFEERWKLWVYLYKNKSDAWPRDKGKGLASSIIGDGSNSQWRRQQSGPNGDESTHQWWPRTEKALQPTEINSHISERKLENKLIENPNRSRNYIPKNAEGTDFVLGSFFHQNSKSDSEAITKAAK